MIFNQINTRIFKFTLSVFFGFLLVACADGGKDGGTLVGYGSGGNGGSGGSDDSGIAAPSGTGPGGGSGRAVSTGGRYQLTHSIGASFSKENTTDSEGRYLIKEK